VDRLQAAHSARLPLSGERLPDASQVLAGLARTHHVPVLAVVDSDDPTLLALLDADVVVTLTPTADLGKVQVTVTERDFGTIGSAYLQPDLLHARFLDAGTGPTDRAHSLPPAEREPRRWNWSKPPFPTHPADTRGSPPPSPTSWRHGGPQSQAATRTP
jgi:hypothetical protein